jgi:hypothetical protein
MNHPVKPKSINELIDALDRIREELLTIQRSLERMENGGAEKGVETSDPGKDGSGTL